RGHIRVSRRVEALLLVTVAADPARTEMKEIPILRDQNLLQRPSFDEKLLHFGGAASSAMPTWRPPGAARTRRVGGRTPAPDVVRRAGPGSGAAGLPPASSARG